MNYPAAELRGIKMNFYLINPDAEHRGILLIKSESLTSRLIGAVHHAAKFVKFWWDAQFSLPPGYLTVRRQRKMVNTKVDNMVKVVRDRIILFPIAIVEVIAFFFVLRFLQSGDQSSQSSIGSSPTLIILLSLLIAVLFPLLILFIYKHYSLKKYILSVEPNFYEHREFTKWFKYYAKQMDQQEKTS